jgi:hypothetical protein
MRAVIEASLSAAEQTSLASERHKELDPLAGAGRGVAVSDNPASAAAGG